MHAERTDVLVVTALQDELEAVLALGPDGRNGWLESLDRHNFRYYRRNFTNARGLSFTVTAAWIGEMGERAATLRAQQLIDELEPECLAMCGICAGKRGEVSLGDVIVAERVYSYDEGKYVAATTTPVTAHDGTFFHDIETYNFRRDWMMDASFFAREFEADEALARLRPPSRRAQRRWLLHAVFAYQFKQGTTPVAHADRKARCPDWGTIITGLRNEGLLESKGGVLRLTPAGTERVEEDILLNPDQTPDDLPFRVHVGAIATGKAVQQDPKLFDRLKLHVKKTLGIEMEGTAIAYVSERLGRRSIIVKAVADHADHEKDDGFRAFACAASAKFLLAFLCKHFSPRHYSGVPVRSHTLLGVTVPGRPEGSDSRIHFRDDLLANVERICRLREPNVEINRRAVSSPFNDLLVLTTREWGQIGQIRITPMGVIDQPITPELTRAFVAMLNVSFRRQNPHLRSTLVHTGHPATDELRQEAEKSNVSLVSFSEYQGLIDFTKYLTWQTRRLENDTIYPPTLYVRQRARLSIGGLEAPPVDDVINTLRALLEEPHPRFALILGDFGTGKTFLLHELARRMATEGSKVTPILVEMRSLEKQRSLNSLLAQHFAMADMGRIDIHAFRYMLAEGRLALLFDGFDELALRVSYERALEHFDTLIDAAAGNAKVVVTSRTQHFLTDHDVKLKLAERAEAIPGYRLLKVQRFDQGQIRQFLMNRLKNEAVANRRFTLLDEVKDLLGLSENPRMLSFIAEIPEGDLETAKQQRAGEITSAMLYALLIERWLKNESKRANPEGTPPGLTVEQLRDAATEFAMVLWKGARRSAKLADLPQALLFAVRWRDVDQTIDPDVAKHQFGSGTLLVRDDDGNFSFVHQSVLEWLVASVAAQEVGRTGDSAALGVRETSNLMADFFIDLAGHEAAVSWAQTKITGTANNTMKKNALLMLRRARGAINTTQKEFEGKDLRGQDFSGMDLRGANFRASDLTNATLVETILSEACLINAKLDHADLTGAKLNGANLQGTALAFAKFLGADLRAAHFDDASLRATKFIGANVDEVSASVITRLQDACGWPPVPDAIEPMVATSSECLSVAWTPHGDIVAAGYKNGVVEIWEHATGQMIRAFRGHSGTIRCVAFNNDGSLLASASEDGAIMLWEVGSGARRHTLSGHTGWIFSVAFSPDGLMVASASKDGTVRLWNTRDGQQLWTFTGHQDAVSAVAFNHSGSLVASSSYDRTVRLWDVARRRQVRTLTGHSHSVLSVVFDPTGSRLASGSYDKSVVLWDVDTGHVVHTFSGHKQSVLSVAFSSDGSLLASGSIDQMVHLWETRTGRLLQILEGHLGGVFGVAFSSRGDTLASASEDRSIRIWEMEGGRTSRTLHGHANKVNSIAMSSNGAMLASGADDETVRLWDMTTGKSFGSLSGHGGGVLSVTFSHSSARLALGSKDRLIRLWDFDRDDGPKSLQGHDGSVLSVAFSPDNTILASGSSDQTVRLWEVQTCKPLRCLRDCSGEVFGVAFSPDGHILAAAVADGKIRLWHAGEADRSFSTLQGHEGAVSSICFSRDGATLVSGSMDGTVRLWDVKSITQRAFSHHGASVSCAAFSRTGAYVASGGSDGSIRLWDPTLGTSRSIKAHTDRVSAIAFGPDDNMLVSCSTDGLIHVWEVATGVCLASMLPAREGWVAFTPDGRYKLGGDIAGSFWHVIGLCRFDPGELDSHLPRSLRIHEPVPLFRWRRHGNRKH